jgi:hypothetical protein
MRTLGNAIDTSLVDLKGGTTGQVLSKTSNTDMDFTWITSDDANAIQNAIVDAKGDLITATAADTPARLAVGSNGDNLVADSSASTGLRYNPPVGSLTNPILNAGFDIWQRGTSFSIPASASAAYYADRFQLATGASQAVTLSRQATGDTTNLPNIQYCARIQRNSGQTGTGNLNFATTLESTNCIPLAGKAITLTFYARKGADYSAASSALGVNLVSGTGTDQNIYSGFTGSAGVISSTATLTTTWQRFAFTGTIGATATQLAFYPTFTPVGTASTNDYYEITGVQIDVGTWTASTAPTFRRAGGTLQGELAACQRYYQRFTEDVAYTALLLGMANATTTCVLSAPLQVAMRTSPTFAAANVYLYSLNNIKTVSSYTNRSSKTNVSVIANTTGLTGGEANRLEGQGSSNGYVEMSAEL